MNIDDMKLGELKEIASLFGGQSTQKKHPLLGKKVVAILPHGFIFFGKLDQDGGFFRLTDASNLRYWKTRDGGLPEFAKSGVIDGDKIDKLDDCVCFDAHISIIPCGDWNA